MTISPPAKVNRSKETHAKPESGQVLTSGIDTLSLAIDVTWQDGRFFDDLESNKELSVKNGKPLTVFLDLYGPPHESPFLIYSHGTEGYRWLLSNAQYALKIGNWLKPQERGRPSILATVRSETLWTLGLLGSVEQLKELIIKAGAGINRIKASRVDICLDILLPESIWQQGDLRGCRVTRSRYFGPHYDNHTLTGVTIGKGNILGRIYDKPMEIRQKSPEKQWFYTIWGLKPEEIPADHRIIRVEFQIRREVLKELSINSFTDLVKKEPDLWAYCTEKWLKFRTRPGAHHTMRKTFEWWQTVQKGYKGAQGAMPLIRTEAFRPQIKQLFDQAKGLLTSLHALYCESIGRRVDRLSGINDVMQSFIHMYLLSNLSDELINDEVFHKRAKYHRFIHPVFHFPNSKGEQDV